jgi:hypothetical protein
MAAALNRLQTDRELAQRLGSQARRFVQEQFSLPAAIDRIEAELETVITQRRQTQGKRTQHRQQENAA